MFKANEKAQTFFEHILDFVAAKKKLDETAERVLPQNFMNRCASKARGVTLCGSQTLIFSQVREL